MTDTTLGGGAATVELSGLPEEPRPERLSTARGDTVIAPAVVATIAGRAAEEVPGVSPAPRSGLDRLRATTTGRTPARVTTHVNGSRATVDLVIAVRYPEPLRQVAEQVRRHVATRIQQMTGLVVDEVGVTIESLVSTGPVRKRVE